MNTELQKLLSKVQKELKASKDMYNPQFRAYFRNAEGILSSVKPLLGEAYLTLSDEIVQVGSRIYVKATAYLWLGQDCIIATAFAREAENKKGCDEAQVTGSASSYARKYALCGLFGISDAADDPDSKDNSEPKQLTNKVEAKKIAFIASDVEKSLSNAKNLDELKQVYAVHYNMFPEHREELGKLKDDRKLQIELNQEMKGFL